MCPHHKWAQTQNLELANCDHRPHLNFTRYFAGHKLRTFYSFFLGLKVIKRTFVAGSQSCDPLLSQSQDNDECLTETYPMVRNE